MRTYRNQTVDAKTLKEAIESLEKKILLQSQLNVERAARSESSRKLYAKASQLKDKKPIESIPKAVTHYVDTVQVKFLELAQAFYLIRLTEEPVKEETKMMHENIKAMHARWKAILLSYESIKKRQFTLYNIQPDGSLIFDSSYDKFLDVLINFKNEFDRIDKNFKNSEMFLEFGQLFSREKITNVYNNIMNYGREKDKTDINRLYDVGLNEGPYIIAKHKDESKITEDVIDKAKLLKRPLIVRKDTKGKSFFLIYTDPNGDGNWQWSPIPYNELLNTNISSGTAIGDLWQGILREHHKPSMAWKTEILYRNVSSNHAPIKTKLIKEREILVKIKDRLVFLEGFIQDDKKLQVLTNNTILFISERINQIKEIDVLLNQKDFIFSDQLSKVGELGEKKLEIFVNTWSNLEKQINGKVDKDKNLSNKQFDYYVHLGQNLIGPNWESIDKKASDASTQLLINKKNIDRILLDSAKDIASDKNLESFVILFQSIREKLNIIEEKLTHYSSFKFSDSPDRCDTLDELKKHYHYFFEKCSNQYPQMGKYLDTEQDIDFTNDLNSTIGEIDQTLAEYNKLLVLYKKAKSLSETSNLKIDDKLAQKIKGNSDALLNLRITFSLKMTKEFSDQLNAEIDNGLNNSDLRSQYKDKQVMSAISEGLGNLNSLIKDSKGPDGDFYRKVTSYSEGNNLKDDSEENNLKKLTPETKKEIINKWAEMETARLTAANDIESYSFRVRTFLTNRLADSYLRRANAAHEQINQVLLSVKQIDADDKVSKNRDLFRNLTTPIVDTLLEMQAVFNHYRRFQGNCTLEEAKSDYEFFLAGYKNIFLDDDNLSVDFARDTYNNTLNKMVEIITVYQKLLETLQSANTLASPLIDAKLKNEIETYHRHFNINDPNFVKSMNEFNQKLKAIIKNQERNEALDVVLSLSVRPKASEGAPVVAQPKPEAPPIVPLPEKPAVKEPKPKKQALEVPLSLAEPKPEEKQALAVPLSLVEPKPEEKQALAVPLSVTPSEGPVVEEPKQDKKPPVPQTAQTVESKAEERPPPSPIVPLPAKQVLEEPKPEDKKQPVAPPAEVQPVAPSAEVVVEEPKPEERSPVVPSAIPKQSPIKAVTADKPKAEPIQPVAKKVVVQPKTSVEPAPEKVKASSPDQIPPPKKSEPLFPGFRTDWFDDDSGTGTANTTTEKFDSSMKETRKFVKKRKAKKSVKKRIMDTQAVTENDSDQETAPTDVLSGLPLPDSKHKPTNIFPPPPPRDFEIDSKNFPPPPPDLETDSEEEGEAMGPSSTPPPSQQVLAKNEKVFETEPKKDVFQPPHPPPTVSPKEERKKKRVNHIFQPPAAQVQARAPMDESQLRSLLASFSHLEKEMDKKQLDTYKDLKNALDPSWFANVLGGFEWFKSFFPKMVPYPERTDLEKVNLGRAAETVADHFINKINAQGQSSLVAISNALKDGSNDKTNQIYLTPINKAHKELRLTITHLGKEKNKSELLKGLVHVKEEELSSLNERINPSGCSTISSSFKKLQELEKNYGKLQDELTYGSIEFLECRDQKSKIQSLRNLLNSEDVSDQHPANVLIRFEDNDEKISICNNNSALLDRYYQYSLGNRNALFPHEQNNPPKILSLAAYMKVLEDIYLVEKKNVESLMPQASVFEKKH